MTLAAAARGIAIAIAALAVIDPVITSARAGRPVVTVIAQQGRPETNDALTRRVTALASKRFEVAATLRPETAAVLAIGDDIPPGAAHVQTSAFAIFPATTEPILAIDRVAIPDRAALSERVPVVVSVSATQNQSGTVDVTLIAGGVIVDHTTAAIDSGPSRKTVELGFVPTREGPAEIEVIARTGRGQATANAAAIIDIDRHAWRVLVFERRPSWTSTFVRRALEADSRFAVTFRTVTSAAVSTATTGAPIDLSDPVRLAAFDAIVIGAPDTLTTRDAADLDAYLRRRGGSVVLLFDQRPGGVVDRLTRVTSWTEQTTAAPVTIDGTANGERLLASESIVPAALPPGAEPLTVRTPVIWRGPVGAGTLVVNGALDAWRHRHAAGSTFDAFWRRTIGDAAALAPAAIEIAVDRTVVSGGAAVAAQITLRDLSLGSLTAGQASADVRATLHTPSGAAVPVRLWPAAGPGTFLLHTKMPSGAGMYRLTVTAGDLSTSRAIAVRENAPPPPGNRRAILEDWTRSRGGLAAPEERARTVLDAMAAAANTADLSRTWHPMRSPWWMAPFAGLLAFEWLARRRRGQS